MFAKLGQISHRVSHFLVRVRVDRSLSLTRTSHAPGHALSILTPATPDVQTLWVPGASHHAWTHPSLPSDQDSVVSARRTIWQFVQSALNHSCLQPRAP